MRPGDTADSSVAAAVMRAADAAADPPFGRLLRGAPAPGALRALTGLAPAGLLAGAPVRDAAAAAAALAALWCYADGFDEAHTLAQAETGWAGSWVHAILHRREPDTANAEYWYARVRAPAPVTAGLAAAAGARLAGAGPGLRALGDACASGWDGAAFARACGAAAAADRAALLDVQRLEWRAVLDACLTRAAGGA